ncbi:MAG TPA: hypothetical protein VGH89_11110 [Pseudonocardia sp.]
MITPPFSISAIPRLTRAVPNWESVELGVQVDAEVDADSDGWDGSWSADTL